jgi:hypothetical protein
MLIIFIHFILLIKSGSNSLPPIVLSYRHPFSQKNEIDKIIQEFLEVGFTYPSSIPYYSLVVIVLKKEGIWGMFPYFCVLNKLTIKDKFPILVIGHILDELISVQYFIKINIFFGYHQVHMKEEYIPNTTFRTCEGRYEFLVMPFDLCNSPSTFQSLMNHVFLHFICHFILHPITPI